MGEELLLVGRSSNLPREPTSRDGTPRARPTVALSRTPKRGRSHLPPQVSKKIEVAGENRYLKKSAALTLVRRSIADWHVFMVSIKMRPLLQYRVSSTPLSPAIPKNYIPEKLPPRDVPGVFFRPPQSDTWKIAHRTVTFMPRECGAR